MTMYKIFLIILILFVILTISACPECEFNFNFLDFYLDDNPIKPNEITTIHIVLDRVYGGRVALSASNGILFTDQIHVLNNFHIFGMNKKSSYYSIQWQAPNYSCSLIMRVRDMEEDGCKEEINGIEITVNVEE